LSDTKVYEPYIRALLGTTSHFCEVVVLDGEFAMDRAQAGQDEKLRAVTNQVAAVRQSLQGIVAYHEGPLLYINVQWFRGGLVFKVHRPLPPATRSAHFGAEKGFGRPYCICYRRVLGISQECTAVPRRARI